MITNRVGVSIGFFIFVVLATICIILEILSQNASVCVLVLNSARFSDGEFQGEGGIEASVIRTWADGGKKGIGDGSREFLIKSGVQFPPQSMHK